MDGTSLFIGDNLTSSIKERLVGKLTIDLVLKIVTVCFCSFQMWFLLDAMQIHRDALSHSERRVAIMLFAMYPIPCMHFFKRFSNPVSSALLVFMTYLILGIATGLIFR